MAVDRGMDKVDSKLAELRQRKTAGVYGAVIRLAQELLANPEGLTDREALNVARDGAWAAMALGQVHVARQFADNERVWAEALNDTSLVAVAAYHQATALLYVGDIHMALDMFGEYQRLDTPNAPALDEYRGTVWFNLGTAHIAARNYLAAADAFRTAREAFIAQGDSINVIRSYVQAAWCELIGGSPEPAGAYLNQAGELLQITPDPALQTSCLVYWALYNLRVGNLPRALELCQEVMLPDRTGVTSIHLADAAWVSGECALRLGHLNEARLFAAMALDKATEARWMPAANRATDLRRRIVESEGKTA